MRMKTFQHEVPVSFEKSTVLKHAVLDASYRTYKDVEILHAGDYVVGPMGMVVHYEAKELDLGVWDSNWLNIDHSKNVLDRVGFVDRQWFNHDKSAVMGDLHILTTIQHGKDVVELIDRDLIDKLSIELRANVDYNEENDYYDASEIHFLGVGIVTFPADKDTRIK